MSPNGYKFIFWFFINITLQYHIVRLYTNFQPNPWLKGMTSLNYPLESLFLTVRILWHFTGSLASLTFKRFTSKFDGKVKKFEKYAMVLSFLNNASSRVWVSLGSKVAKVKTFVNCKLLCWDWASIFYESKNPRMRKLAPKSFPIKIRETMEKSIVLVTTWPMLLC